MYSVRTEIGRQWVVLGVLVSGCSYDWSTDGNMDASVESQDGRPGDDGATPDASVDAIARDGQGAVGDSTGDAEVSPDPDAGSPAGDAEVSPDPDAGSPGDECPGNTCGAGGTCVDGVSDYTCTCASGYSGSGTKVCSNINDCPGNTCGAGTNCVDGVNTYTCADINECAGTNVCTADYLCTNTAPDYYCRGLFPEWQNVGAVGPYTANGGIVTDAKTGLRWQQAVDANRYNWAAAKTYCAGLSLGGSGWRLPTKTELESIVNFGVFNPAIDATAFPSTPGQSFWSSSAYVVSSGYGWVVNFFYGDSGADAPTITNRVRCVR